MNIELIKSELERLSLLLSEWSAEQTPSPIERDIALDSLKRLYNQIRFPESESAAADVVVGVTAVAAGVAAAVDVAAEPVEESASQAVPAPKDELEEWLSADDEEKDVEVELIFADEDEDEALPEEDVTEDEALPEEDDAEESAAQVETSAEEDLPAESVFLSDEEIVPVIIPATEADQEGIPEEMAPAVEPMVESASMAEPAEEPEPAAEPAPVEEPVPAEESAPAEETADAPEDVPADAPAEQPAEKPAPRRTFSSLFGNDEELVRRPRPKHQRMMSIYNADEPRPEKVVDISKIFDLDDDEPKAAPAPKAEPAPKAAPKAEPMPAPAPEPKPAPAPAPKPVVERMAEERSTVLADAIAPAATTLADTLAAPAALGEEMNHSKIASLREGIGINDKFLMIRDLFDGDGDAYAEAIEALDSLESLDDCMIHIIENYAWNPDTEGSKFIMQLLDRKFL